MKQSLLRLGLAGICLALGFLAFADDAVRKVPKDLNLPVSPTKDKDVKLSPPASPPDRNSGNNSSNNSNNGNNDKGNGKVPVVNDDHCKGSPGCSTVFDGGKSSKN
jgi:hypothetical protein